MSKGEYIITNKFKKEIGEGPWYIEEDAKEVAEDNDVYFAGYAKNERGEIAKFIFSHMSYTDAKNITSWEWQFADNAELIKK